MDSGPSDTILSRRSPFARHMPRERQCRICLAGEEDNDELGRMIKPCLCKGSMRYVHVQCLNTWRTTSQSNSAFWACPQCKYKYAFSRTRIQGLASSKVLLGTTTLTLFTFLVFFSSFIVSFFLPDLDPSALSARKPQQAEPASSSSIFEWTFGYSSFQTPWSVAGDMIRLAVETFADVEQAWDDKESSSATKPDSQGAQEDARDGTRTGAFKSTVRKSTKPKESTNRSPPKKPSWIVWFIRRYVIGTAFIGSISFLNMFAFGPLPLFRGRLGRGGRRDGTNDTITALVIIFLVIGVGRALYKVYQLTEVLAQKLLIKAETAILEVGGDEEEEEEDNNTSGPAQSRDSHQPESSSGHSEDWQQVESEPGSEEGSSKPALRQRRPPPLYHASEPNPLGSDHQWEVPPSPGGWSW